MADSAISIDEDGCLRCPECGSEWTHTDILYVSARREDDSLNEISVNAITGQINTHGSHDQAAPVGSTIGQGRRHRIAVTGYCETGGHNFAIVFAQHKGSTFVEVVTPIPHWTGRDPKPN